MASSVWYRAGTISIPTNSKTVTGTNTKWADSKQGIGQGQMLLVPGAGTVQLYEIASVDSDTQITLNDALVGDAVTDSSYAIPIGITGLKDTLVLQTVARLSYYQSQMDGWQQIMTSDGSVTLTAPDGTSVTISSFKKLTDDMAGKALSGANSDITEIKGLTTALSVAQGGTGAATASAARTNLGLKGAATLDVGTAAGTVAAGNDSRLATVNSKTGGTITSGIDVSGAVVCNDPAGFFATGVNSVTGGATTTGLRIHAADRGYDIYCQYQYVTSQYHQFRIVMNSTAALNVRSNGAIYAQSFNPTSDGRLKLNKEQIKDGLSKVETLNGYTFDLFGERKAGLIAQDIQKVLPEVVTETFVDHTLDDGTEVKNGLAVDYGALTGLLVEAIKELSEKVTAQDTVIQELQARLKALDGLDA